MWGQLGRLQQGNNDEEGEATSPGGNNLWSQLGSRLLEVAADVAQDLAQPQDEDGDEDEEYYEEEGEGWDESLGLDGTPSWEEQPSQQQVEEEGQYYEGEQQDYAGGEEQYYEGEQYEEGGEQQQYAYQEGEEQYADDDQQQQTGFDAEDGWGQEEEVDFSREEEQNIAATESQESQPLFGAETTLPQAEQEPIANTGDEWDLEDEDLFDDDEQQAEASPQEEEQQQFSEEYNEPAPEEPDQNAWDHEESLNFGDEHDTEGGAVAEEEGVDENVASAENPVNEWDQDDVLDEQQKDERVNETQIHNDSYDTAHEDGGGAWDDDGLDLDGLNEDQDNNETALAVDETFATAHQDAETSAFQDTAGVEDKAPQSTDQAQIDSNENKNAWDMDEFNELNISSHHETTALDTPQPEEDSTVPKGKKINSVSFFEEPTDNIEQQEAPPDVNVNLLDAETPDANADEGNAWGTDEFDFSSHPDTSPAEQPLDSTAPEENDAWGNDDLQFSERNEDDDPATVDAAQETSPAEQTLDSTAPEVDNAWGNDDLQFSERNQDDPATVDVTQETSPAEQTLDSTAPEVDNAWGNDDLQFSEPNEDDDPVTVDAAQGASPSDQPLDSTAPLEDDAWGNDDLQFSERNEDDVTAAATEVKDTTAAAESEETHAEGDDGWGDDVLNFSGHPDEHADAVAEDVGAAASDDAVGDSETQETGSEGDEVPGNKSEPPDLDPHDNSRELGTIISNSDVANADATPAQGKADGTAKKPNEHAPTGISDEGIVQDKVETQVPENAWNDSDEDENVDSAGDWIENQELVTKHAAHFQHNDDGGDDSTVELSNIGFVDNRDGKPAGSDEASASEVKFALPARTPSRRATIRASNTSSACLSRRGSEDEDSEPMGEKILGTSVMFADMTLDRKESDPIPSDDGVTGTEISTVPSDVMSSVETPENVQPAPAATEVAVSRDALSSVSDYSSELPKPTFETQISMITLRSTADSCPSRQRDNDSDNEEGYGPVVDKTPEVGAEASTLRGLSTMTINSTAVAAHSIGDDIKEDDDMDGTYYGSTAGEGQETENAWEEDDATSLGGLHDLSEKIVNFELSTDPNSSAAQEDAVVAPLSNAASQEAEAVTPPLDSSMAILYADDNSVPSRDKDDDNEEEYKPVVDQIPKPLQELLNEKSGRTLNSMAVLADTNSQDDGKNEESSTEKGTNDGDNGWDDDGFLGDIDEGENGDDDDDDNESNPESNQVVIDNTPMEANSTGWKFGGSLAAVASADNSCPSRVHDSDEEVYGLMVDQIPALPAPLLDQMSVTALSMAVVANKEDLKENEELDASDHGESTVDGMGVSAWENEDIGLAADQDTKEKGNVPTPVARSDATPTEGQEDCVDDRLVDLTPKIEGKKVSRFSSNSLAVLAHSVNLDEEDDEDEDNDSHFGPVVDKTPLSQKPPAMTPSSTAVQATRQDETTEGGVGGWDDPDFPELEDMESGDEGEEDEETESEAPVEESVPVTAEADDNQVVLVDHTPEAVVTPRKLKGDASIAVLAPSEDGTVVSMINDDDDVDTIDPHGERVSYGPVVDTIPAWRMQPIGAPSTAPSVTFSLAVEARSVASLDDEMDETFCGDTTIGETAGENGWGDDQTLEDLDADASISRGATALQTQRAKPNNQTESSQPEIMVDHTPQLKMPPPQMGDASLVALAPSEAGTYRSATDSAIDDDTITHEGDLYGKVVDHTPRLAPLPLVTSNSMAVTAGAEFSSEMEREEDLDVTLGGDTMDAFAQEDGWGEEDALDEIDADVPTSEQSTDEIVVDHTPVADTQPKPALTDPSVAVLAPSDDGSREEDNDTYRYDEQIVFGPMVDQTPQPEDYAAMSESVVARHDGELEGTLYGDSTVGGDNGWDEDDNALDNLDDDEEKESESVAADPTTTNLWQSAELVSDNASSHLEGSTVGKSFPDASSSQDGVVLVDHTPSEIDASAQKNSVAWLVNVESGISGDETEDAGAAGPAPAAEEDQVVDRIPHGAASRYGDASTLVVADPSEVLSHVGDMLQEEGDFGPVVDLTPPTRPTAPHVISAAGSTVAVAPTVGRDDLDDADADDTVNAGEGDGWEQDPSEIDQTPNPQSGNEEEPEAPRVREQVVDFLPPPQRENPPDQNRDGWSEVATGGAPSVLAADPRETDFGPVVDQLPVAVQHANALFSAISTASQVASSECDALAGEDEGTEDGKGAPSVLVDPLPSSVALQNLDSTASLVHSLASEDEDDDDARYGPVVDHLPSIRSSLPPSRGGSTVDALATVSEVIDDDDDDVENASSEGGGDNGWGDDDLGEIDLSERIEEKGASSDEPAPAVSQTKERADGQSNQQGDRSMTVRFQSVVAAIFESSPSNDPQQLSLTSAEDVETPAENSGLGDQAEPLEPAEPNAWDDDVDFDVTFNTRLSGNDRTMLTERLTQFSEADTPPATPYSRSKTTHRDADDMPPVGVALPDLSSATTTKLKMQCNTCENATTNDCPCVQRILRRKQDGDDSIKVDYNKLLQSEITKRRLIEEETSDLRLQLDTLKNSKSAGEVRMETVRTLQEHVKVVEGKLQDAEKFGDSLRDQNKELQSSLADAQGTLSTLEAQRTQWVAKEASLREEAERIRKELHQSLEINEKDLKTEVESKQSFADNLSRQLGTLQEESSRLRTENESLTADITTLRQCLKDKESQIAKLEADLQESNDMIFELEMASESARELQDLYKDVESELVAKTALCEQLRNDVSLLERRVQAAEGEKINLTNESASLRKQHDDKMASLQSQLERLQLELDESKKLRSQEAQDGSIKLAQVQHEYDKLCDEKQVVEANARDSQSSSEAALIESRAGLAAKVEELHAATEHLSHLQEQNTRLAAELEDVAAVSAKAQSLEAALKTVQDERESLKMQLQESNDSVARLQQRIDDQGIEEGAVEQKKNIEIEALVAERSKLQSELVEKGRQIENLEQNSQSFAQEKAALSTECERLQAMAESSRVEASDVNEHLAKLLDEFETLQNEVVGLEEDKGAAEVERDHAAQKSRELETSLTSALHDVSQSAEKAKELEFLLSQRQEEHDQLFAKCNDLEALLAEKAQDSHEIGRLIHDNTALYEQVTAFQQELANQNIVLQNFEARAAALEHELSAERQAGATKDETLISLQEQLESTRRSLEMSTEGASKLPERIAELEQERDELGRHIQELSNQRNQAVVGSEGLAQENEEMLVQFGLLNEQLDAYREQANELQNLLQSHEQTTAITDARILELQQQLVAAENVQRASSEQNASLVEEKNRELIDLRNEQINLIEEIQALNEYGAEKDDIIISLTNDLESVKSQLAGYEELKADSAFITRDNDELRSQIENLEMQRDEVEANFSVQEETISALRNELDESRVTASSFEDRVKVLEEACADREAALQQKEGEIRELVGRLHDSSGSSVESTEEILELRNRLNEMEASNQETMDRVHQLVAERDTSEEELAFNRKCLAAAEASAEQLEQELAQQEEEARKQSEDQEAHMSELENKLQAKKREVAELTHRSSDLVNEVEAVRAELDALQSQPRPQPQPPALAVDEAAITELESLRGLVFSLEEQLESSKCNADEREEVLQEEINALKGRIATKDGEALVLKNRVESLRGEVQSSREQVEGKVAELQGLASEMDSIRKNQEAIPESSQISAFHLLEATKENAENLDSLRATVISLASALETSENLRADAIDRLLKERETYAVSLRHFSDSVKRFYTTLSFNNV
ncbi:kinesin K39 [Seminavis robusta]|uniref:Kinesin K39 n=1 Tax=Seminavis robusta TaxID=568900 RepID=A0A9N8HN59_9STRA|nr:kinesin K39 [Seminavis robusta]|eukprot:Sro797_g203850.1 kinesin K39 (3741) ;mRNA; r:9431-20737